MKKLTIIIILLSCFCSMSHAQNKSTQFKHGKLPNGLTYYIQQTTQNPGAADFYLVQNVGALMENADQNGLAHVLEHMAFHATTSFPEGIPAFLQRHGINTFNANTGYDETIYNINNIPVATQEVVDSCILALRDWSGFLTLKPEDMDQERKVIREERRLRMTLSKRMQGLAEPYLYNHSKYATHNIIGSVEVVRDFTPEQLKSYYQDFYRPDQQAVIIIGDINVEKTEKKVRELFIPIPKRENPKPRLVYNIEDNTSPLYAKLIDKDIPNQSVMLVKRFREIEKPTTEEMIREILLRDFYNEIMRGFLAEYVEAGESYILTAGVVLKDLVRNYDNLNIALVSLPGKEKEALQQLLNQIASIHQYGFTDEILKPMFVNYQNNVRENLQQTEHIPNNVYLQIFKDNFLLHYPLCSVKEKLETTLQVLDTLSASTFQTWIAQWYNNNNNWAFLMQGNDANYPFPVSNEIISMIQESHKTANNPQLIQTATINELENLIDFNLPEGQIVKSKQIKTLDAEEWTLSNGAKVYYKYTDGNKGLFNLLAGSKGGRSLLKAEDLPSADALTALAQQSGVYKYDGKSISFWAQQQNINMHLALEERSESIGISAPSENADNAFQYLYLTLQKPRFDTVLFERFVAINEMTQSNARPTVNDSIRETISGIRRVDSPRLWKKDSNYYKAMNYNRMTEIFQERFQNASDFTFYLVGDISKENARRLITRYIASLPSTYNTETAIEHQYDRQGNITQDVEVGIPDAKYMVSIEYENHLKTKPSEAICMRIIRMYLQHKLMERIRGNEGAAYTVQVQGGANIHPYKQEIFIRFATELAKGPQMRALVHEQIQQFIQNGISDEETEDYILAIKKEEKAIRETSYNTIGFWTDNLQFYNKTGKTMDAPEFFDNVINKIKGKDVKTFAQKFFKSATCIDLVIKSRNQH